jgi:hypothetical protein
MIERIPKEEMDFDQVCLKDAQSYGKNTNIFNTFSSESISFFANY